MEPWKPPTWGEVFEGCFFSLCYAIGWIAAIFVLGHFIVKYW